MIQSNSECERIRCTLATGQVGAINFMETYFNAWWLGIFFTVSIPILVVYFVFLFWTVFMSAVSPIRNGGSNRYQGHESIHSSITEGEKHVYCIISIWVGCWSLTSYICTYINTHTKTKTHTISLFLSVFLFLSHSLTHTWYLSFMHTHTKARMHTRTHTFTQEHARLSHDTHMHPHARTRTHTQSNPPTHTQTHVLMQRHMLMRIQNKQTVWYHFSALGW